jgi:hypothetical protein
LLRLIVVPCLRKADHKPNRPTTANAIIISSDIASSFVSLVTYSTSVHPSAGPHHHHYPAFAVYASPLFQDLPACIPQKAEHDAFCHHENASAILLAVIHPRTAFFKNRQMSRPAENRRTVKLQGHDATIHFPDPMSLRMNTGGICLKTNNAVIIILVSNQH